MRWKYGSRGDNNAWLASWFVSGEGELHLAVNQPAELRISHKVAFPSIALNSLGLVSQLGKTLLAFTSSRITIIDEPRISHCNPPGTHQSLILETFMNHCNLREDSQYITAPTHHQSRQTNRPSCYIPLERLITWREWSISDSTFFRFILITGPAHSSRPFLW